MIDLAVLTNPGGGFSGLISRDPHPNALAAALIEGARNQDASRPNLGLFFDGTRYLWTNGHAMIFFGAQDRTLRDLCSKIQEQKNAATNSEPPSYQGIAPKVNSAWSVVELGGPLEGRPMKELGGVDQVLIRFENAAGAPAVVTFNRELFFYPFKSTGTKPDGARLLIHPPELVPIKGGPRDGQKELATIGGCYLVPQGEPSDLEAFQVPPDPGSWIALIMPMRP